MSFQDEFSEIISSMSAKVDAVIPTPNSLENRSLVFATYRPNDEDNFFYYSSYLYGNSEKSNHQKLANVALVNTIRDSIFKLNDLIRKNIPALDSPALQFSIDLKRPKPKAAPRIKFSLCNSAFNECWVTLPTVIKRIESVREKLQDISTPGPRAYRIETHKIFANSPQEALIIHFALDPPKSIAVASHILSEIEVTEILDKESFLPEPSTLLL
jgi:hypothetical protein